MSPKLTLAPSAGLRGMNQGSEAFPKDTGRVLPERLKALYIFNEEYWDNLFGSEERAEIAELVDVVAPMQTRETIRKNKELLSDVEILLSGWWAPLLDEEFLMAAPHLKAVFYGSGSVKNFVTEAFWKRDIVLSSANSVFVIPVAEFAISQIVFCLKQGWQYARELKRTRIYWQRFETPGCFGSKVGLVSLGSTGRLVAERLRDYDLEVIAYDPFASASQAETLGVRLCSLEELFATADIVSVHTPLLPETENMIRAEHFSLMKKGATFLNTARGAIVNEEDLARVFTARSDLFAVLDVVYPEPPSNDNPLFELENVVITPHISGAMGRECRRGGRMVVEELRRYLRGQALLGQVTRDRITKIA